MRRLGLMTFLAVTGALGCATANHELRFRELDHLPRANEPGGTFAYAESTATPNFVGHLSHDSLWIFRWRGTGGYQRTVRPVGSRGVEIGGYTLTDGRHVKFDGTVRRSGDSLAFERRQSQRSMEAPGGPDALVLPMGSVQSVDVRLPDTGQTLLAVTIITLFAATAWVFAVAASLDESVL